MLAENGLRQLLPSWTAELRSPGDCSSALRSVWQEVGSFEIFRRDDGFFRLTFLDQMTVDVDLVGRRLAIDADDAMEPATIRHFLADQVVPRVLAHGGQLVLHAAAVCDADSAILFLGPSRAGKSTIAAHFRESGFTLLGDDAIRVEADGSGISATAIYPSLRLFGDSIGAVLGPDASGQSIGEYTAKRSLGEDGNAASGARTPVRALVLIDPEPSKHIVLEPITAGDRCIAMVEHSFWLDPIDLDQTQRRMALASNVATRVSAWTLRYPRRFDSLAEIRDRILDHAGR